MPFEPQTQRQIRGLQTQITTLSSDIRGVRNAVEEIRQQNNQLMTLVNQLIEQPRNQRPPVALSSSSSSSASSVVALSPPPRRRSSPVANPEASPVYEPGSPDWSPPPQPPQPPHRCPCMQPIFIAPPPPEIAERVFREWRFGPAGLQMLPPPAQPRAADAGPGEQ